jgi:hypothetical protein
MVKTCSYAARRRIGGFLLVLLFPGVAYSHVILDSPVGGESLDGGFTFSIDWHVHIMHNTQDWDLWYTTVDPSLNDWTVIVSDLPKGNITAGAAHTFDWHVPNSDITAAWVRVRQDNSGTDYEDVSGASFSIAAAEMGDFSGNGVVNGVDLQIWEGGFGTSSGAFFTDGDDDSDGDVDGGDFLRWQRNALNSSPLSFTVGVPEPASLLLLALGGATALFRRR